MESRVRHIKAVIQSEQDANPTYISMLEVKDAIKGLKKERKKLVALIAFIMNI